MNDKKREETPIRGKRNVNKNICLHTKTVAINEEGHAGIFCVACGEKLEDEC